MTFIHFVSISRSQYPELVVYFRRFSQSHKFVKYPRRTTPMFSNMPRLRPNGVPYPDWIRAQIENSPATETTRCIAQRLNVSQSTVSRVLRAHLSSPQVDGSRHSERVLTEDDAAFLCILKCEYPQVSLSECQLALESERGKIVSLATVSREIQRLGMTRKKMQRFSSRRDESARVRWWTMPPHLGGCAGVDWKNLVDIDESTINFGDSQRRYGHSFAGLPARCPSLVRNFFGHLISQKLISILAAS